MVLRSAAAGVALVDADIPAALEHGGIAYREAAELGVERELPLILAVLARATLEHGDTTAAAQHAANALDAALAMSIDFPLAVGLETAAVVLHAADRANSTTDAISAELIIAAEAVRVRGNRPPPSTLAVPIDALRTELAEAFAAMDRTNLASPRDVARRAGQRLRTLAARTSSDR